MNNDFKKDLIEKYRKQLGCKNDGICWCNVCASIEEIISETIKHIKNNIPD